MKEKGFSDLGGFGLDKGGVSSQVCYSISVYKREQRER
jgi:hypothetical protein